MAKRMIYRTGVLVGIIVIVLACAGVWSGFYNVGADVPHWSVTYHVLAVARERSIEHHAQSITVPNLDDPSLILKGAGQYAAMCTECHLAPGMQDSELRKGLYPKPPVLYQAPIDPREAFWTIKHGVKLTAMPAWGATHDDDTIWSMVAFLQKLNGMTPAQYKEIVAKAPPDEDMDMGNDKGSMQDNMKPH
ncbi:cytochrome c [Dyella sp. 2HG41-7]|uniref:c-type cytochrome n=1 Tax=Dyella sp. 2HG41-7 TaxID=2883239 RepID=UPI0031F316C5